MASAEDRELTKSLSIHTSVDFGVDVTDWSSRRKAVARLIHNPTVEVLLALMVLTSLGMIIIETDSSAQAKQTPAWAKVIDSVLMLSYCLEMGLRCYVLRISLFMSVLDTLDFAVVVTEAAFCVLRFCSVELPHISFLRVIRLVRMSRAFRVLRAQQQLMVMSEAVFASIRSTLFGCFFIGLFLLIYSIIAVDFLGPHKDLEFAPTCGRCPHSFDSVYASMLTLIQTTIVGEDWGVLFIPYLEEYPGTCLFILGAFVTVNLGLMNLIIAAIIDAATEARSQNSKRVADERREVLQRSEGILKNLVGHLDGDKSGTITLQELLDGYDHIAQFRHILNAMDIDKEDMQAVFGILDVDRSGDVEYSEFVSQLHRMRSNNANTMLVFIKHYVTELRKNVADDLMTLQHQIAGGIHVLHQKVEEELALIKENNAVNIKALETADRRLEATLKAQLEKEDLIMKEEQVIEKEIHQIFDQASVGDGKQVVLPAAPVSYSKAPSRISSQKISVESQLQMVAEKVAAALEDLKCRCETSAELMVTFRGLLPQVCTESATLSLHGVATGGETRFAAVDRRIISSSCCPTEYRRAPQTSISVVEQKTCIPAAESSFNAGVRCNPAQDASSKIS